MSSYNEHNKQKKLIPDNILKLSEEIIGCLPSIIETDFYTIDVLNFILKANNVIYSQKYYDGSITIYNKGLIDLDNKILLYFIKKEDENTYKFCCLSKEDSTDSIIFYLNKFKKYKTIS
jgi:hypothetical protein